jgi:hypothetical protein
MVQNSPVRVPGVTYRLLEGGLGMNRITTAALTFVAAPVLAAQPQAPPTP